MKTSKLIATLVMILMVLTALFGCATVNNETASQTSAAQSSVTQPTGIYIYQAKVEIDAALKAACDEYTKLHPNITFKVESSSSGDFQTQLKAMFSGSNAPDIFSTTGNVDLALMSEYMEDLSNEPWVQHMSAPAKEGGTYNGKILGFPVGIEGHGFLYHKDMFKDASITDVPKTRSELEEVCKKLTAKGITPFAANYSEWYQTAMFKLNSPIARQSDPLLFIQNMNAGKEKIVGNKDFIDMAALIAIEAKYSKSPLTTDFNTQTSDFTGKKAAMMIGGSWSQPTLDAVDPKMDVGMFPIPMSEDAAANDKFYAQSTPFWSVNKDSKSKEECKKFLQWLAADPAGQKNLTSGLKLIPAFTNIKADESAIGPTGTTLKNYIDAGKVYGIYSSYYPKALGGAQVFGESINKYAAGKLTADQLLEELQKDWASLQ